MSTGHRILPADSEDAAALARDGWTVVARSWAAELDVSACDEGRLQALVRRAEATGVVRRLTPGDLDGILALDAATIGDYPGGAATRHAPLTRAAATVGEARRAYGVVEPDGTVAAVTFVDVDGPVAEIDFTAVAPARRRRGLATAVKAASVLDLASDGVRRIRTGGSDENVAILAANTRLGFVVDEEWLTLAPAGDRPG